MRSLVVLLIATPLLCGCGQQTSSQPSGKQPSSAKQQSSTESAGVVQNVRQAAKRTADMEDLKNFALAYVQYFSLNSRGPAGVQDIKDSLSAKTIEALKDNSIYVVIWNIRNLSGEDVVAYAAEPDTYGTRLVAKGDGSVTRTSKEDFDKLNLKR